MQQKAEANEILNTNVENAIIEQRLIQSHLPFGIHPSTNEEDIESMASLQIQPSLLRDNVIQNPTEWDLEDGPRNFERSCR